MKISTANRKLKNKIRENAGMTLVELIVVFALVGIFMVAATFMLTASLRMFERMQATSQAVTVSDLILDKISGEIAAAENEKGGYYFWLEKETDASWTAFCNRSGSPISMFAENGELILKYYEMASQSQKTNLNEIDWRFDKNVYMNYKISHLGFSFPDFSNHPTVVKIDLTLTNQRTGYEYQTTRYAENYNFDFDSDYMCVRNDGNTGRPAAAEEFKIDEHSGGGETTKTKYIVEYHIDGQIFTEELLEEEGVHITLYPKPSSEWGYAGYEVTPGSINFVVGSPEQVDTFVFIYKPIVTGTYNYTLIGHVAGSEQGNYQISYNGYTGDGYGSKYELYTETHSANLEDNGKLLPAPSVVGYTPININYAIHVDPTYSPQVFVPYKHAPVNVTIYAKCGDMLLDETVLTGKFETKITLNVKEIDGYEPLASHGVVSLNQLTGNEYTFYYKAKAIGNHPFTPIGPNVVVTVDKGQVPWQLTSIANAMKAFYSAPWNQITRGENLGYYKTFSFGGKTYAMGGWSEGSGDGLLKDCIQQMEKPTEITEVLPFKMNSGSDQNLFWEYLANAAYASDYTNTLQSATSVKFDYEETHISQVTFTLSDTKQKVTIKFQGW